MKIEFSNEQYKTLLKMLFFADWFVNSYKVKDSEIYKETEDLQQYLFSFARTFGQEKWITFYEIFQKYMPTIEMEDELMHFVYEYNDDQKNRFIEELQCLIERKLRPEPQQCKLPE
ncbi:MAG: hypothetical protein WCL06_15345 [Bacteroidota bacterium]